MKIILFLVGIVIGAVLRNVIEKIIKIRRKIQWAEEITTERQKQLEFKQKYDFGDSFSDDEEE